MKQWRATLTIAFMTLLEAIRNRLLSVALVFAVVLLALSVGAASVSLGERARLMIDVGLFATSGLGSIVAATLMITSFASELRKRTAYIVLTRPVSRNAFVLGKFLGVYFTMLLVVSMMFLATAGVVKLYSENVPSALYGSLWLSYLEMSVVISIALFFSTLAVPSLAASYTAGVVIAGNLAADIADLADQLWHDNIWVARILKGFYFIVADLQSLSLRSQAANNLPIPKDFLITATQYGVAYSLVMLCLAMLVFNNKRAI